MSAIAPSSRNALPVDAGADLAASAPSGAQFAQRITAAEPPRGAQQAAAATGSWDGANRISPNPSGEAAPEGRRNMGGSAGDVQPTYQRADDFARPRAERMSPPTPFAMDGQRFDIQGVDSSGHLVMRPHELVPRLMPTSTLVGREVRFEDRSWTVVKISSTNKGKTATYTLGAINGGNTIDVPANADSNVTLAFSNGRRYRAEYLPVEAVLLKPVDQGDDVRLKLHPGMIFQARLRGREQEGAYTITVGPNDQLHAEGFARDGSRQQITILPGEIAPRFETVASTRADNNLQIDSFRLQEMRQMARADTDSLRLPSLPPDTQPRVVEGQALLAFMSSLIAGLDRPDQLIISTHALNAMGQAEPVISAIQDVRARHPSGAVTIVNGLSDIIFGEENVYQMQQLLAESGIQETARQSRSRVIWNHSKGIIADNEAFFVTGSVSGKQVGKADIIVPMSGELAAVWTKYVSECIAQPAGLDRRHELLAAMADKGLVFNDPVAKVPLATRTINGLIEGASHSLNIWMGDMRDPETMRVLVAKARDGVEVRLMHRGMDPSSQAMADQAEVAIPNFSVEFTGGWRPYPHFNAIIADGSAAYVGTAYLYPPTMTYVHEALSYENGVRLSGASVANLSDQLETLRRSQSALQQDLSNTQTGASTDV
jgi:hypothetical protein